jgi:hypothetical protein
LCLCYLGITITLVQRLGSTVTKSPPRLPCPECIADGVKGIKEDWPAIGSRKRTCRTCNNFSQNVMRLASIRLRELHRAEYDELRCQVTVDLYPQVIEDFKRKAGLE